MVTQHGELAINHLEKLNSDLREELKKIEVKIAELEADNAVGDSRVSRIAEQIVNLARIDAVAVRTAEGTLDVSDIQWDENKLVECIQDAIGSMTRTSPNVIEEIYSDFRAKLMHSINTVELVTAALKKSAELEKSRETESRSQKIQQNSATRTGLGSSAIIRSQELERQRIAREIHDGPAQAIANVVLRMDILRKIYEKNPAKVPVELYRMKTIAEGALNEIRGFIFDLRPMTLQDLGLVATIKRVVSGMKDLCEIDVRFVVEGTERPLGQNVNLAVFRIAQEALNNMRKYSNAQSAWVHLKFFDDKVILIVEDDGIGFEISQITENQKRYVSFGLLGMQERADDIGAELEIESVRGEGTKVVLVIPDASIRASQLRDQASGETGR